MGKMHTSDKKYAQRLIVRQNKNWKTILRVQKPYEWHLRLLKPGKTLDIGCGIGRNLKHLSKSSVGVDHNKHLIHQLKELGYTGFTTADFTKSKYNLKASFDSLLFSHILEHMKPSEAKNLIRQYLPTLKSGGKVIIFCPQQIAYRDDPTHVTYCDFEVLEKIIQDCGLTLTKRYSFPFPKIFGSVFKYNEFVVIAQKS